MLHSSIFKLAHLSYIYILYDVLSIGFIIFYFDVYIYISIILCSKFKYMCKNLKIYVNPKE
jgi:hypothetical protein